MAAYVEPAQRIVIDGLRHPEDSAYLRERWGMAAFHIYIDAPDHLRAQRYAKTTGGSKHAFYTAETHSVEKNAHNMRKRAEAIVTNSKSIDDLRERIREATSGMAQCRSLL